jgi:hypothetical protein
VFFWLATVGRYLFSAFVALLLSLAISVLATLPFAQPNDDLGISFLWVSIFALVASLFLPLCLGITAELIQRKVLARRFSWSKALLRSLVALPIAVGPVYVAVFVGSRRPAHWVEIEILFYSLSAASAYVALRISKQPPQPVQ